MKITCGLFFVSGLMFGVLFGDTNAHNQDRKKYQRQAIELGCGEYDRKTGEYKDVKAQDDSIQLNALELATRAEAHEAKTDIPTKKTRKVN